MVLKSETPQNTTLDWLKWIVAIILFIAGLFANYYYNSQPWPIRMLGWLVLISIILSLLLQTNQGKRAIVFAKESRIELRKVFWPTRQETIQTTLVVGAMVVVLAVVLWGIDSVLMWLIGWLTGQRG